MNYLKALGIVLALLVFGGAFLTALIWLPIYMLGPEWGAVPVMVFLIGGAVMMVAEEL